LSADTVIERVQTGTFWPLPRPQRADGQPRRIGVEIEFAGLNEAQAAGVAQKLWGGAIEQAAPHRLTLRNSRIGDVRVLLDTGLARHGGSALAEAALEWSRIVVPVEIVMPPLPSDLLPETERLARALRAAGAEGTRAALAYGFGVHLNIEVPEETRAAIVPVVRAFALIEDWLRAVDPIDPARRMLPFVDPYPRGFVDLIATEGADWSLEDLAHAYLAITPTRNRGLDALPLLEHLFPQMARLVLGAAAKGGRPAWHYRLPEARLGEPGWTIAYEWNRWCIVERVAADADLLESLATGWQVHRAALTTMRGDWAPVVEEKLQDARIWAG